MLNDFENDFFKLMINSVYGKTMELLQKRINVRLVNNTEDFLKHTSKATYITHKVSGKDYAAIHEIKSVLILNKSTYVGFTVLDVSKWKMYDFHDSFIKTFFNETNKNVIGNTKDEFGEVIVDKFVGLKSKMYSVKKINDQECNTAEGVSIATEFDKFKDVVFNEKLLDIK